MDIESEIIELREHGFCVLRDHFPRRSIGDCYEAFLPFLSDYLRKHSNEPNRGPHRHFLPMPFEPPCFAPEFFFDTDVLTIARQALDERIVADQWGCDVPLRGSQIQNAHVDYQRPLFPECPDLPSPPYMLVVNFSLINITPAHGPIEIAAGTHRMARSEGISAVQSGKIEMEAVPLRIGDVLVRHPWALHRGTPNITDTPRPLVTIRYVRHWYADNSRDANSIPIQVWRSLTPEQRAMMHFPVASQSVGVSCPFGKPARMNS